MFQTYLNIHPTFILFKIRVAKFSWKDPKSLLRTTTWTKISPDYSGSFWSEQKQESLPQQETSWLFSFCKKVSMCTVKYKIVIPIYTHIYIYICKYKHKTHIYCWMIITDRLQYICPVTVEMLREFPLIVSRLECWGRECSQSCVDIDKPMVEERPLIKGHIMRFMPHQHFAFIALCLLYGVHRECVSVRCTKRISSLHAI